MLIIKFFVIMSSPKRRITSTGEGKSNGFPTIIEHISHIKNQNRVISVIFIIFL